MVVVQLAEWLLRVQEDPVFNPAIGNFYWTYLLLTVGRKDENKRKRGREWNIFNIIQSGGQCDQKKLSNVYKSYLK